MSKYFQPIIEQLSQRSAEATLSILGITDPDLRHFLSEKFNRPVGSGNNFLGDPVFEAIFGWEQANIKMERLAGSLLERSLIDAMDKPPRDLASDYAFRKEWVPYKHQLQAWQELSKTDPRSIVITSGTGSGKTECFMVPVLNDLVRQYEATQQTLMGVQALFIYPLNALINSQRHRLRAWTNRFDSNIRFCLYNGNTKEKVQAKIQAETPNEILSRTLLRLEPPPLLVTNSTMLEYMLVRQTDAPILEKSQGKLRWIILDEAHSYIGSQAAELSLLLRRVMHGFGVKASDVRFVATSATIGDKDDDQLQQYLASLAGISTDQVSVIGGQRVVPDLPKAEKYAGDRSDIASIDSDLKLSEKRYKMLVNHTTSRKLRKYLTCNSLPKSLNQISRELFNDSLNQKNRHEEALAWLDLCSDTVLPDKQGNAKQPFLPIRGHLLHQVINGLWCCVDPACKEKTGTALEQKWPFGYVYSQRKTLCNCGAPVFELIFCNDCNAPHLQAVENGGRLVQLPIESVDEFSLQMDFDIDVAENDLTVEQTNSSNETFVLASKAFSDFTWDTSLSINNQVIGETEKAIKINVLLNHEVCSHCAFGGSHYRETFRRSLLGTPFYISNTVPTLLEFCQEGKNALDRPGRGRRLITFTDSRQGTARIATKIQQDSERNKVRGLVYYIAANQKANVSNEEIIKLKNDLRNYQAKAEKFKKMGLEEAKDFFTFAKETEIKIQELISDKPVAWNDLVSSLQTSKDISMWMLDYYNDLNPVLFSEERGCRDLIQMLLVREFAHRPKRQNSLETLGLVSVQYPALDKITTVPKEWESLNLNLSDWKDFLKICLDFYVRTNKFISIPKEWINWIGMNLYTREVIAPDSKESTSQRVNKWPLVRRSRNNRLVRILAYSLNLDLENADNQDVINQIMRTAWSALTQTAGVLTKDPGALTFQLKLDQMAFSCPKNAWICPVTHRLLDCTFRDITPYLPTKPQDNSALCQKVAIPVFQSNKAPNSEQERLAIIRLWCNEQPEIQKLRSENLWTDLSDRIVEGGQFFRTAEHSAQQPSYRLQKFEALFKEAKLNVLSCSTTMEMGVDIGGISVVAMNNVPPHPANYLQRAGRAGRRQETRAMAFTICKDNPHERSVFANSLWPFITHIKAPYITLNSSRIVQRHINSLVLAYFLKHVLAVHEKEVTKLDCGWFFCSDNNVKSLVDKLCDRLDDFRSTEIPEKLQTGLISLIKNSILEGIKTTRLLQDSCKAIQNVRDQWLTEHDALQKELDSMSSSIEEGNPYRRRLERDLDRLKGEYLLSELAARGYLPGYGFPTGIASFDPYSIHDYMRRNYKRKTDVQREDNTSRVREKPGRNLSIAIREYAPGANIVLNGLAYQSAGITLNWHIPDGDFTETQKIMVEWRCHKCGAIDHSVGSNFDNHCSECGESLRQENIREFIEPAGFAVDFYSNPTTDISTQHYVPVQEPWVVAKNNVMTLPSPELGMFRSSADGHIFYHSSGEHNHGYAICMACGRAESVTSKDEFPVKLKPGGKPHKKLRGKPEGEDGSWCNGTENEFAIKSGLHLGYVDRTDVFELYIKWPGKNVFLQHENAQNDSKKIAWTLAVVLSQALADILGINSDELGYTVKPATLSVCNYPVAAIVLYDKCSGGAGFASSAPYHFEELFVKAKEYLNCPDHCEGVCQSCLMGYDTRFHIDLLDRHVALAFLNDDFMSRIALPDELKILGQGSHYSSESIFTEIRQAASKGASELQIFLYGQPDQWEIAETQLLENFYRWNELYSNIVLLMGSSTAKRLPDTVKEDLWVLTRLGIKIGAVSDKSTALGKKGCIVAQAFSNSFRTTLAQSNQDYAIPKKDWLSQMDNVTVYSNEHSIITIDSFLDEKALKPVSGPGDVEIEIIKECNGLLSEFGPKFWQLVMNKHALLNKRIESAEELTAVHYSDRFLYSPWSLMLVGELIDGLRNIMGTTWNKPAIYIHSGEKRSDGYQKNGLFADWLDDSFRLEIIEKFFEYMDEKCTANSLNDLPHGRFLKLIWSSGMSTIIRLDQGVGYWVCEKSAWLKNIDSPDEVVSNMMGLINKLRVKNQKEFPTQVFIKERGK